MLTMGQRPDGTFIHPMMPYWMYVNMQDDDLNAMIAYLRTVAGIDNRIGNSQAPFAMVGGAVMPLDLALVPSPVEGSEHYESAMRGRYLAVNAGACIECHTPEPESVPGPTAIDFEKFFWGGREFPAAALGLPVQPMGPFPEVIRSANLTSHMEHGIGQYTVEELIRALKHGVDREDEGLCPPMPAGMMAAFGGLTDEDALDIAHYMKSLPAVDNEVAGECALPMGPPPGDGMGQ
jgi:cytochrome c553